jgi:hypothetical protein
VSESSAEGAKQAVELLREQSLQERRRRKESVKIGGLVNLGVGLALIFFLRSLMGPNSPYLCGLIPAAIGVAMLVYIFFLAAPIE